MYSFQYIDMHALLWLVDCGRARRHVARVLEMWGGELVATSGPGHSHSMAILTYLKDPEHSGAGLSEIAGAVSIPTSTCLNLLRTLVHFGLLSFDANTKQYRLGWALFELGSRAADHLSHVEVLRPHLSALAKTSA